MPQFGIEESVNRRQGIRVRSAVAIGCATQEMVGRVGQKELIRRSGIAFQMKEYAIDARIIVHKSLFRNGRDLLNMLIDKLHRVVREFAQVMVNRLIGDMNIGIQSRIVNIIKSFFRLGDKGRVVGDITNRSADLRWVILVRGSGDTKITVRARNCRFATGAKREQRYQSDKRQSEQYVGVTPHENHNSKLKTSKFAAKVQKNLHMSKKSITFAADFV